MAQPFLVTSAGTQVQVTPLSYGQLTPTDLSITVNTTAAIGSTLLDVTVQGGTSLQDGLYILANSSPNQFYFSLDGAYNGAGLMKVQPLSAAITAGTILYTYNAFPLIGLEGANLQLQTETNQAVLLSNGGWQVKDYSTGNWQLSGNYMIPTNATQSASVDTLINCLLNKQHIYVERILPNGTYFGGQGVVTDVSDQVQGAAYVTMNLTIQGSNKPVRLPLNSN